MLHINVNNEYVNDIYKILVNVFITHFFPYVMYIQAYLIINEIYIYTEIIRK